ncbi:MAG: nitronate monooxygenase [Porphyromonas sp.]|nr:nitronate monooxygenase [Bacteroidales bacterium]MDY3100589.1 nitronate monooxygenase [Porphyromonas sp.]
MIPTTFENNPICKLFKIRYPVISGGMIWCSGPELAAAVSAAGGLGLLGSGSMRPDDLRENIRKVRALTDKPFGVNIPISTNKYSEANVQVVLEEKPPVVFTSAGNPKTYTKILKDAGMIVAHVVSSSKFARKAEEAGCDAVVAEGFEAGGHNGREETTTLCLLPDVCASVSIPVIGAGGIASGRAMAAAFCLGAVGVQVGTAFALSEESAAHPAFKNYCLTLGEGDTMLLYKKVSPTRLVKGAYFDLIKAAEDRGASADELRGIKGVGRAREGMALGNLSDGELEIGQAASQITAIRPASAILSEIVSDFHSTLS